MTMLNSILLKMTKAIKNLECKLSKASKQKVLSN